MPEYVNCNFCGRDDTTQLYQTGKVGVVQCNHCGLVYTNPRLNEEERLKIYNTEEYFSDYLEDPPFASVIAHLRFESVLKHKKMPGKILEIGCGTGCFLDVARKNGWVTYGIEISELIGHLAREKLGLEVFIGPLEDAPFVPELFDVICMFHLLEHLPSPKEYCQRLYRLLKPDGLLVVEVPVISLLRVRKLKRKERELHPSVHLFHFSRNSLAMLLSQAGYKIINIFFLGGTGLMRERQGSIRNIPRSLFIRYFHYLNWLKKVVNFIRVRFFRQYAVIVVYARKVKSR